MIFNIIIISAVSLVLAIVDYFMLTKYLQIKCDRKTLVLLVCGTVLNAITDVWIVQNKGLAYALLMDIFVNLLIVMGIEDSSSKQIDSKLSVMSLALGIIISFFVPDSDFWKIIVISAVIGLALYLISKKSKEAIGKGDVICITATTLCFSLSNVFACIIYSLLICMIYGVIQLLRKKIDKKQSIPFIPFLILGILVTLILA